MKLLFDQNISRRLVQIVATDFPGTVHVSTVGLETADDSAVWDYAAANGCTIVSKDADFYQRSSLYGQPPKIVWIRKGNCSTTEIADLLTGHREDILVSRPKILA